MKLSELKIPVEFWQRHRLLPLEDGERFVVGMAADTPRELLEDIRLHMRKDVKPQILTPEQLDEGLRRLVLEGENLDTTSGSGLAGSDDTVVFDLLKDAGGAPVVKLVNSLFLQALEMRASDIHIEPFENETVVRLRIDGVLHEFRRFPPKQQSEVVARLKVLSKLDLAESRRPQDGRLQVKAGGRTVDVRLSCVPTLYGERLVMRLLEKNTKAYTWDQLGLAKSTQERLHDCLGHSYGLVLVTGPTGSGKTTTLYSVLEQVRSPERNVLTIEDPVEYNVAGVGQIQVNDRIGVNFAAGLRSILRQDPDVVMVGEIRDAETANIAVNAALTGHLVLSTLHTNDAPSAATRLIDLKVPPFLLSSCLLGVLAQRLVRRLCDQCKIPAEVDAEVLRKLNLERPNGRLQMWRPVGCPACMQTGYRGRMGLYEFFKVDDKLSSLIAREADARVLRTAAHEAGMFNLLQDASHKIFTGQTSLDEALRVARS